MPVLKIKNRSKNLKSTNFSGLNMAVFVLIFAVIGALLIYKSLAAPNPNLTGDLNNDNKVDSLDLSTLLSDYLSPNLAADINGDNKVDALDLSALLSNFGRTTVIPTSEIATEAECPNQIDNSVAGSVKYVAMTCMTNHARAYNGNLAPLSQTQPLMSAGASKANDIVTCNDFSHTACGRSFDYWMFFYGFSGNCWGENIAEGFPTVRDTFVGWMNSPGHRANILNASFSDIGLGLASSATLPRTWVMELAGCK